MARVHRAEMKRRSSHEIIRVNRADVLALGVGHEVAHVHVVDHALAQRANGLACHGKLSS